KPGLSTGPGGTMLVRIKIVFWTLAPAPGPRAGTGPCTPGRPGYTRRYDATGGGRPGAGLQRPPGAAAGLVLHGRPHAVRACQVVLLLRLPVATRPTAGRKAQAARPLEMLVRRPQRVQPARPAPRSAPARSGGAGACARCPRGGPLRRLRGPPRPAPFDSRSRPGLRLAVLGRAPVPSFHPSSERQEKENAHAPRLYAH